MQCEEGVGEEPGLRPAPSLFVGGDVGPEVPTEVRSGYSWCSPPRKMHKRCRKRSSQLKWQKESSVQGEEAVCKDASSSVQED